MTATSKQASQKSIALAIADIASAPVPVGVECDCLKPTCGTCWDNPADDSDKVARLRAYVDAEKSVGTTFDPPTQETQTLASIVRALFNGQTALYDEIQSLRAAFDAREIRCECRHSADTVSEKVAAIIATAEAHPDVRAAADVAIVNLGERMRVLPSGDRADALDNHAAGWKAAGIENQIDMAAFHGIGAPGLKQLIANLMAYTDDSTVNASLGGQTGRPHNARFNDLVRRSVGRGRLAHTDTALLRWLASSPAEYPGLSRYYLIRRDVATEANLLAMHEAGKAVQS